MSRQKLREAIAQEAARLILRGKVSDYGTARKRAARWRSRRKVHSDDLPTNSEIEQQIYALAGLTAGSDQQAALMRMRDHARLWMERLDRFEPRLTGSAVDGPVLPGSEIELHLIGRDDTAERICQKLLQFGVRAVSEDDAVEGGEVATLESIGDVASPIGATAINAESDRTKPLGILRFHETFPCRLVIWDRISRSDEGISQAELETLLQEAAGLDWEAVDDSETAADADEKELSGDDLAVLQMLLERLERVSLDRETHPEGDALYHSLQVFELGYEERSFDEEFLLACLLHEVGQGIDRHAPVAAAIDALSPFVTPRTLFLIEHLDEASEYLRTGRVSRSLRRSEHFDDLTLLARCDRDGRVPGMPVRSVEEALASIASLQSAWDEEE